MKLTSSFISHVALVLLLCLIMTTTSWAGAIGTVDREQDLPQQDKSSSHNFAVASSLSLRGAHAPPLAAAATTTIATTTSRGGTNSLDESLTGRKRFKAITSIFNFDGPLVRSDVSAVARFSYYALNAAQNKQQDPIDYSYSVTSYRPYTEPDNRRMSNMDFYGTIDFECGNTCSQDNDDFPFLGYTASDPFYVVLAKAESGFYDEELKNNNTRVAAFIEAATLTGNEAADTLCSELRKSGVRKFKSVRGCRIRSDSSLAMDEWEEWSSSSSQVEDEADAEDRVAVLEE
jgi:hypothetical protein